MGLVGRDEPVVDPSHGLPLAAGRTAEIYPWGEGMVLKLFYAWFSPEDVEYEAHIASAVHAAGLRVPAVGAIIKVDGRFGLIYERLQGVSPLDEMRAKPWTLGRYSRLLADLQAEIHAAPAPHGIPRLKEKLERKIQKAPGIRDGVRDALLEALELLPDGNGLCHGDFHPGNVILTVSGPVVIDWIDAAIGAPWADIARTRVLIQGEIESKGLISLFERLIFGWGHRAYQKRTSELQPAENDNPAWLPVVAAARLSEGIEGLAPWLLRQAETILMN